MEEESIYNLIPREFVPPKQEKKYKSKYPHNLPPTGSTFNNKTTSRPGVSNLRGEFEMTRGPHTHISAASTFGKPEGAVKRNLSYTKAKSGRMGQPATSLPKPQPFKHDKIRPPVPKRDEKPVMGLQSNKNYIITNAVENILSQPKVIPENPNYLKKKDFGKTPDYLNKIKDDIQAEYTMIQNLHISEAQEQERQKYIMSQEEVTQLRNGLKQKWEAVNKEYQTITHIKQIDTVGLKRKKEECEKVLQQLEKDIEKLNKKFICVDTRM